MKKKIIFIMSIFAMFLCLTGCGSTTTDSNDNSKSNNDNLKIKTAEKINIDNIQSKISELGVSTETGEVYYQMVGAEKGIKLYSGDYRVEIYKFNKSSDEYKTAENTQKLSISEDYSFDAVVKNGYAYVIDNEFPNYDAVVSLLDKLQ